MFKWFASSLGCLTAVAVGYIVVLNADSDWTAPAQVNDLSLPLEQADRIGSRSADAHVPGLSAPLAPQQVAGNRTAPPALSREPAVVTSQNRQNWTWRVVRSGPAAATAPVGTTEQVAEASGLTRKIQRAAQRAGCGQVHVTGYWDQRTRTAVAYFIQSSNAALPVDAPDPAILSLLENYKGDSCGQGCRGASCSRGNVIAQEQAPVRLVRPPTLAARGTTTSVISGWTTTMAPAVHAPQPQRPRLADGATAGSPSDQVAPAGSQLRSRYGVSTSTFGGTRMALGAAPLESRGAAGNAAPLTIAPAPEATRSSNADLQAATGASAQRAAQIRAELLRERQREISRAQRPSRRYSRSNRRRNWRAQAFAPRD